MKRTTTNVVCGDCGMDGPEAELVAEARELADQKGWLVTDKSVALDDYCPQCRKDHEVYPCAVSHGYSKKPSIALYTLEAGRGGKLDGYAIYSCGMHISQVLRELYAGGAYNVVITKIATRRR